MLRINRRTALSLGLAAGIGGLTGCRVRTEENDDSADQPTAEIVLPEPPEPIPDGPITYKMTIGGGIKEPFIRALFEALTKKYPNITADYSPSTPEMEQALILGIRNNTASDIFAQPSSVPTQVAVNEGWYRSLDEIMPTLPEIKERFGTAFIPGVNVFDGVTYSTPLTSSKSQFGAFLFFNRELMDKAGVDPVAERLTWTGLRDTAKKITDTGGDGSYGLLVAGDYAARVVNALAQLAGWTGPMDFRTGEYNWDDEIVVAAVELMLAMKQDGSLVPGSATMTEKDTIQRMTRGAAGITFSGGWAPSTWQQSVESGWTFGEQYDIAEPPTPDDGSTSAQGYREGTIAGLHAYAKSEYPQITAMLLDYIASVEGQATMGVLTNGMWISPLPEANKRTDELITIEPEVQRMRDIQERLHVRDPLPEYSTPAVAEVQLRLKKVKPAFKDIVLGAMSDQVDDVKGALKKLNDAENRALDDAIAAARDDGADVSRDAYVFSNWAHGEDYADEDYDAR